MKVLDVAVVGGGPAGAATALSLVSAGRSVILLERLDAPPFRAGETLSPEIFSTLRQLGVWDDFLLDGPCPTHGIWSAWGEPKLVAKDLVANPYGPAWRVDRERFDRMLRTAAERAGARVEMGIEQLRIRRAGKGWRIAARRGIEVLTIESRFVVDATGRAAAVARTTGVRWRAGNRLVAFIGVLAPSRRFVGGDDVLLIEAVSNGWWYSSILPGGELVAAFLTDVDLVRGQPGSPTQRWEDALARSKFTIARADGFRQYAVHTRSARTGQLDNAAGPAWVAVGDAASAIDPLSGMGIAKGLRSAILAARAVDNALGGCGNALETYACRIRRDHESDQRMAAAYYTSERRWPDSPFWRRRHMEAPLSFG